MTKRSGRLFIGALIGSLTLAFSSMATAQSFAPVAVVNDQIITGYDVAQRARLMSTAAGGAGSVGEEEALEALIEDTLRIQAAQRAGIDPSPEEVAAGFEEIARLNKRDPAAMRGYLRQQGVSDDALDTQMKAEVAWRQLIRQRYGARARVSESEVNQVLEAQGLDTAAPPDNIDEPQYLLAEMRFPIGAGGAEVALAHASNILAELKAGGSFSDLARQKSLGPTAAAGGDLGWLPRSALTPKTAEVVSKMGVQRVSEPFVDGDAVLLVGLRDTRAPGGGGGATQYTLAQLVVPLAAGAPQAQADAALAQANAARAELSTCADVEARKAQYHSISGNIGALTLAAMPGPVREAVAGLEAGQITPPVRSNDGFHVIVVCDKSTAPASAQSAGVPSRDTAANVLRAKRLDRYARSFLRELRRDAVIERR